MYLLKRNLERLSTYKTRRWEKLQRLCEVHMADIRIKCLFVLRDPRSAKSFALRPSALQDDSTSSAHPSSV